VRDWRNPVDDFAYPKSTPPGPSEEFFRNL
jgi:hypothetical protein